MRPVRVNQTGVGVSSWVPVNYRQTPFNMALAVEVTGTVTYTVEHTFENVWSGPTPVPFGTSGLTAQTANAEGNIVVPVMAVRLNVTAGTGSATMVVLQGTP